MQNSGGRWGNFLDSTLDRVADGALFAGVAVWFFTGGADPPIAIAAVVCLVLGMVVSYARAKAEALGFHANVGIAERAERLVSVLVVTGFTGWACPPWCFRDAVPAGRGQPRDGRSADHHSAPAVARGDRRHRHRTGRLSARPCAAGVTGIQPRAAGD